MKEVFVVADNIVSPLGDTTAENFKRVSGGESGITQHADTLLSAAPFYASMLGKQQLTTYAAAQNIQQHTKFEQLVLLSVTRALAQTTISLTNKRTILIVSTTKGNIELLEQQPAGVAPPLEQMELFHTARQIGQRFGAANAPLVVSNACISGLLAILTGKRLIDAGLYDHAVITGADVVTQFVLSGFQSFQAVSNAPCRPFDAARNGVTLGEGAATIILTNDATQVSGKERIVLGDGSVSNDANHISGPSRTGAELSAAMQLAMNGSGLTPKDIGFVSAHGTATLYNDEMEAKALHLAALQDVPVNSLKGYYGHTLGAAGLIEAIIGMACLRQRTVLPTLGFETLGVSMPVQVSSRLQQKEMHHFLKTVSGFGGCNAAMVFSLNSN
jgi:3-oxoacyl-[acyl-carrier-protein] synthase-1